MPNEAKLAAALKAHPVRTLLRNFSKKTAREFSKIDFKAPSTERRTLPVNFDGRLVWGDLLQPVSDQGQCGSCWAVAGASCLADRYSLQSLGQLNISLSAAKILLCDWMKKETDQPRYYRDENMAIYQGDLGACDGNTLAETWHFLFRYGTCTEECAPYDLGPYIDIDVVEKSTDLPLCQDLFGVEINRCIDKKTPMKVYRSAHSYRVVGTAEDGGSAHDLMEEIFHWGTVATGLMLHNDFYDWDGQGVYEWDGESAEAGGHAVVLVGWGRTPESGKNFWIVRNSWGDKWGDQGYFKILRGVNHCNIEENVVVGIPDIPSLEDAILGVHKDHVVAYHAWSEAEHDEQVRSHFRVHPSGYPESLIWEKVRGEIDLDLTAELHGVRIPDINNFWSGQDMGDYRSIGHIKGENWPLLPADKQFVHTTEIRRMYLGIDIRPSHGDTIFWWIFFVLMTLFVIALFLWHHWRYHK